MPRHGNVSFLHFTDCHAQLLPVWFREPNVNLGLGGSFYNNRIDQMKKTIEQIEGDLRVYMDYHEVTSIPTVPGTCVLVKREKPVWDENAAWEYINRCVPEDRKELIRIREELNKTALKERMKIDPSATYVTYETTEGVVIRKRGQ